MTLWLKNPIRITKSPPTTAASRPTTSVPIATFLIWSVTLPPSPPLPVPTHRDDDAQATPFSAALAGFTVVGLQALPFSTVQTVPSPTATQSVLEGHAIP